MGTASAPLQYACIAPRLQVTGPVKFASGVALKGDVEVTNSGAEPAVLMAGEYANTTVDVTEKVSATVAA